MFKFRESVFLACLLAASVFAQSSTSLRGHITDASGAVIPQAEVRLTQVSTAMSRSGKSNAEGLYEFPQLQPGTYSLTVAAPGFATAERTSLELLVNVAATLDVKLEVAGVGQTVEVAAAATMVNTSDASLGAAFNQNQVSQLPIEARNVVQLLSLQPGVTFLGDRIDATKDTRSGSVNGARSDQSNVTLDGVDVNDQNNGYAFTSVLRVTQDSVQEFRITTSNANADAGRSSGAQVALVTKSGTNDFHGSAYEYNRNTIFSANEFFIKTAQLQAGQPNER
ncbi:MAG TPA: carboxypeptidase-like regulatory domain-containing protein, partial [Bryobacteraceae bacterium]|nr:carboxypeptidase-like regulatory domain-containing protein [Bryobacteraceae bacterium]